MLTISGIRPLSCAWSKRGVGSTISRLLYLLFDFVHIIFKDAYIRLWRWAWNEFLVSVVDTRIRPEMLQCSLNPHAGLILATGVHQRNKGNVKQEIRLKGWEVLLRRLKTREKWPLSERPVQARETYQTLMVAPGEIPLACKLNNGTSFLIKEQITLPELWSTVCKHLDISYAILVFTILLYDEDTLMNNNTFITNEMIISDGHNKMNAVNIYKPLYLFYLT